MPFLEREQGALCWNFDCGLLDGVLAIERERRSRPSVGLISVVAAGRVQAEDIAISMHATVSRVLAAVILYLCVVSIELQTSFWLRVQLGTVPEPARARGNDSLPFCFCL